MFGGVGWAQKGRMGFQAEGKAWGRRGDPEAFKGQVPSGSSEAGHGVRRGIETGVQGQGRGFVLCSGDPRKEGSWGGSPLGMTWSHIRVLAQPLGRISRTLFLAPPTVGGSYSEQVLFSQGAPAYKGKESH